jgi:hypothetical protein
MYLAFTCFLVSRIGFNAFAWHAQLVDVLSICMGVHACDLLKGMFMECRIDRCNVDGNP